MKILLIVAIVLSTATAFAQEDFSVPEKSEKTLCPLARKAASEKTEIKADDSKNEDGTNKI